jgi:hypothetical protein
MERGAGTDEVTEMRFATADPVDAIAAHVPERDRVLIYVAAYGGGGARWIRTIDLILIRAPRPDSLTGSFARMSRSAPDFTAPQ